MSPLSISLILVAGALLAVVLLVISVRRERERTETLRQFAETAGLAFEPKVDMAAMRSLGELQLFTHGHSRRVTNLMSGRLDEQQVTIFDYRYTTGGGRHQQTHHQTVLVLPSLKPSLPDLQMAPENPLYKIAEVFGYQDIDIESSPEFSRRYVLRGADEAGIRAALYPNATSYFGEHEGWTVEVRSGTVVIYRASRRPKAEEMRAFVAEASTAARTL